MKTLRNFSLIASLAFVAASAAHAATWTYSSTGPASADGLSATASAFSAANNTTATITATTAYYSGGLGVTSSGELTSSPQHAVDNNGAIETVMFAFSNGVPGITAADKVNLTQVNFGWVYSTTSIAADSDFSVYAYTGTSATPTVSGMTYSNMTTASNGWTLIGHYNGGAAGTYTFANSVYSSHWLIGAYNGLGTGLDTGDDYFKIASVTGTKCPTTGTIPAGCGTTTRVPEPGTLLLLGAGLLGLTRMTRRPVA